MARPGSRGGSRTTARGGGRAARSSSRSSGRGGGGGNGPLIGLGVVGVLLVVFLIVVASSGGDEPPPRTDLANNDPAPGATGPKPAVKQPPRPLTDPEKNEIRDLVRGLAPDEKRAEQLKDEGFRAHAAQDYETAQAKWHEAQALTRDMIAKADRLFGRIGEERVQLYAKSEYRSYESWIALTAEFFKYLK